MMQFRSPYNHDRAISAFFATHNKEESMTQQGDAAECDINVIMKKYGGQGGQLPHQIKPALSGDFTNVGDYRDMVERLAAADAAFQEVPAEIRGRFLNDPQKFMEFVNNKDNLEEMRKLGLANPAIEPPPPPEPMKVVIVGGDKTSTNPPGDTTP